MNASPEILPFNSHCYVEIYNVTDSTDGSPISNADVKVNLYDRSNVLIANASNLTALYDTPNNLYRATIPPTAGVTEGQSCRCEAVLTIGGLTSRIWVDVIVKRYPGA